VRTGVVAGAGVFVCTASGGGAKRVGRGWRVAPAQTPAVRGWQGRRGSERGRPGVSCAPSLSAQGQPGESGAGDTAFTCEGDRRRGWRVVGARGEWAAGLAGASEQRETRRCDGEEDRRGREQHQRKKKKENESSIFHFPLINGYIVAELSPVE